jgi:hypothetical protein
VIRVLCFSGLIRRTTPFCRLLPHKGMWRTYSYPDPHGSFGCGTITIVIFMDTNNYSKSVNFQNFRMTLGVKICIFIIIRGNNSGCEIHFDHYVHKQLLLFNNFSIKFRACYLLNVLCNIHIYLKAIKVHT